MKNNPYLEAIRAAGGLQNPVGQTPQSTVAVFKSRRHLVKEYAWAVPNDEAIEAIVALGQEIVEVNAGSGYWASLIKQTGGQITVTDLTPWPTLYAEVLSQPAKAAAEEAGKRGCALMTVWPEYDEAWTGAFLRAYLNAGGQTVIYVGESRWGCTGDDTFHQLLEEEFTETQSISIPQWPGVHDYLAIYQRKAGAA